MLEATVSIENPDGWMEELSRIHGARILDLHRRVHDRGGCSTLVDMRLDPHQVDAAIRYLGDHPQVEELDLEEWEAGRLHGIVTSKGCKHSMADVVSGVFVVEETIDEEGLLVSRIVSPYRSSIRRYVSLLENEGVRVNLLRLTNLAETGQLTSRQESMLRVAYFHGYFDEPKGTTLKEIAAHMGVSIATASEMLTKGRRKLIARRLAQERQWAPGG